MHRRGITFIEIMAALALFSAVVATALVSMRAARESLDHAELQRRARQTLQTWRIAKASGEPLPEEFEDDDGWTWRIVDEGEEQATVDVSDEQIEAALNAPDLESAAELLGANARSEEEAEEETEEEVDLDAPLVQISWSTIRVEALSPSSVETEPQVVLRWRYIDEIAPDEMIAAALSTGSDRVGGGATAATSPEVLERLRESGVAPPGSQVERRLTAPTMRRDATRQRGRPTRRREATPPGRLTNPTLPRKQEDRNTDR